MPKLQNSFTIGNIITIAIILGSGLIAYGRVINQLDYLSTEVQKIQQMADRLARVEQEIVDQSVLAEVDRQGKRTGHLKQQ